MEKIYATMKGLKIVYVGERSGVSKASGKAYTIQQVQVEQVSRNGMKTLHIMTIPPFNKTELNIGDTIDAEISVRAAQNSVYLDLIEHRVLSSEQKLKAVSGGAGK